MAVIKGAESRSAARGAIVLDLGDIGRQAQALERRAVEQANQIVERAQHDRRRLISSATAEGRAAGHAEGLAQGDAEGRVAGHAEALRDAAARFDELARAWDAALQKFESEREEMLQGARADTLAFAAAVALRITRRVIALDSTVVADVLAAALALTIKPTRLVIEVNPEDHTAATEAAPALLARFARSAHAELRAADSLTRGSVLVRTDEGVIDATVETQIQRILDASLPDRSARFSPSPSPPIPAHSAPEEAEDSPLDTPPAESGADDHDVQETGP